MGASFPCAVPLDHLHQWFHLHRRFRVEGAAARFPCRFRWWLQRPLYKAVQVRDEQAPLAIRLRFHLRLHYRWVNNQRGAAQAVGRSPHQESRLCPQFPPLPVAHIDRVAVEI